MSLTRYRRTSIAAIKAINGALLNDGDLCELYEEQIDGVMQYSKYYLKATSGATENSPNILSPDLNAGSKRWHKILLSSL